MLSKIMAIFVCVAIATGLGIATMVYGYGLEVKSLFTILLCTFLQFLNLILMEIIKGEK